MENARSDRWWYRCSECGVEYAITPERMVCDHCSARQLADEPLRGILEVAFDPAAWRARNGRNAAGGRATDGGYAGGHGGFPHPWDLLPVDQRFLPTIPVGNTPLWQPARLRDQLGFPRLYLKDDAANPTGSLKDRASFLVAGFAAQHGITDIVLASTGNAGSSMAGVGAAAGLRVRLFLPATAPEAKLAQASLYGADLVRVDGTYDVAYDQSMQYLREHGGLSRNTGHNPLTIDGKKTVSLEIVAQLGAAPDFVFVSCGDGVIVSGVYRGLENLLALGAIDHMPTVVVAQSAGSAAVARAWQTGTFGPPVAASTVADSISVDVPRAGWFALGRLQRHNGRVVVLDDRDILIAQQHLARYSGLFTEPAGAAAFAAFLNIKSQLPATASVVILLTGNGLKDVRTAMQGVDSYGSIGYGSVDPNR